MADQGLSSYYSDLYHLYRPYFGFRRKKLWRTLYAVGILLCNVAMGFCFSLINTTFLSIQGVLAAPVVTYTAIFGVSLQFASSFIWWGIAAFSSDLLSRYLGISLSEAIAKKFSKRWLRSGHFHGMQFLVPRLGTINPAQVLSADVPELTLSTITFTNIFLNSIGDCVVGFIGLYTMSQVLVFTVGAVAITIPGYMAFASLLYAAGYNYITHLMGKSIQPREIAFKATQDKFYANVHNIQNNRESIVLLKGQRYEENQLRAHIILSGIAQRILARVRGSLFFIYLANTEFSHIIALFLAIPSMVAKKVSDISLLISNFRAVLGTWGLHSDYYDQIAVDKAMLRRVFQMQEHLDAWESVQANVRQHLRFFPAPDPNAPIEVRNLNVSTLDGKPLLSQFNAKFKKGEITYVSGSSGSGKTTLLRAMVGNVVGGSGEVIGLPDDTMFIPSQPYFPLKEQATPDQPYNSLLEIILYPRMQAATPAEIQRIRSLLHEIGFGSHVVDKLEHYDTDWNNLSDGQKQRIMIMRALFAKPSLVIMDEATSRVDHDEHAQTKQKIEAIIKRELKTVIFTDHNVTGEYFYDSNVVMPAVQPPNKKLYAQPK